MRTYETALGTQLPHPCVSHAGAKPHFRMCLGIQDAPWEEFVFVLMPRTFA